MLIQSFLAGTCPLGYTTDHGGDFPGWGSIIGYEKINDIAVCAEKCDNVTTCCSFEFIPSLQKCNLNRDIDTCDL